jgi:hypothetical protein
MRKRLAALRVHDEGGQAIIVLVMGCLAVLMAVGAIVVDVGHAYLVERKLQSVADAAALAGADALPNTQSATTAAVSYGPGPSGLNKLGDGTPVTQSETPWCLQGVTYCFGNPAGNASAYADANGVVVNETAAVKTTFMKMFGVPSITVHATATACGTCSSPPLDIALVVDRTGSMAGNMADLRAGIDTFLESLDPSEDDVSLLVLPPPPNPSQPCNAMSANGSAYPYGQGDYYPATSDDDYLVVHLSHDYKNTNGTLNQSSQLVQDVNCLPSAGSTAYKQALVAAQNELVNDGSGRKGVQRVIVFETDGAANEAPDSYYQYSSGQQVGSGYGAQTFYAPTSAHATDVSEPCGSAVDYANGTIKPSGTQLYTVGYQLGQDPNCYEAPQLVTTTTTTTHHGRSGHTTTTTTTTYSDVDYRTVQETRNGQDYEASRALADMAAPNPVFQASDAATMSASFGTIAGDITGASLVPNSEGQ